MENSFGELQELKRRNEVLGMKILLDDKNYTEERNKIVHKKDEEIEELKQEKYDLEIRLADKTDKINQLETTIHKKNKLINTLKRRESHLSNQLASFEKELTNQISLSEQRDSEQKQKIKELQEELQGVQTEIKLLRTKKEEDSTKLESFIKEQLEVIKNDQRCFQEEREAWKEEKKHLEESRKKQEILREIEREQHKSEIMSNFKEIKSVLENIQSHQTEKKHPDVTSASECIKINEASNFQVAINQGSNVMSNRELPGMTRNSITFPARVAFQQKSKPKVQNKFTPLYRR